MHLSLKIVLGSFVVVAMLMVSDINAARRVYVESMQISVRDGVYYLDADTVVRLRKRATTAIRNGVPLYFDLNIGVYRERNWWIDKPLKVIHKRYRLFYFELTQHYRLSDPKTGEAQNFRTLDEAVAHLGQVRDQVLLKKSRLKKGYKHFVRLHLKLDLSELPAPLQLQAYVTRRWLLKSDVYEWPLR